MQLELVAVKKNDEVEIKIRFCDNMKTHAVWCKRGLERFQPSRLGSSRNQIETAL